MPPTETILVEKADLDIVDSGEIWRNDQKDV